MLHTFRMAQAAADMGAEGEEAGERILGWGPYPVWGELQAAMVRRLQGRIPWLTYLALLHSPFPDSSPNLADSSSA